MAIKHNIRKAINQDGKFIVLKVHGIELDTSSLDGTQSMLIEITVRKRIRKKTKNVFIKKFKQIPY